MPEVQELVQLADQPGPEWVGRAQPAAAQAGSKIHKADEWGRLLQDKVAIGNTIAAIIIIDMNSLPAGAFKVCTR